MLSTTKMVKEELYMNAYIEISGLRNYSAFNSVAGLQILSDFSISLTSPKIWKFAFYDLLTIQ